MVFAILFFASFVVGLFMYALTDRWWSGGLLTTAVLFAFTLTNISQTSLQGVTLYFGIPIVFLGSLFGAYIVQIRRAPELSEEEVEQQRQADEAEK